ncbi:MAG: ABC transporter transmembrane domain-containing protein, partial [Candidatus Methanomethylophilaceae archaeon]
MNGPGGPPRHRHGPGGHGPSMPTEKANDFKDAWSRLFAYMDRYRIQIVLALLMAFIGTILTLLGPNMLSDMTDLIQAGLLGPMDLDGIVSIAMTLLFIYAAGSVLTFIQQYIMTTVSQRTARNFRSDISSKINRLPLRYFDRSTTGDIMSRVTNDIDTVGQSMNQSI